MKTWYAKLTEEQKAKFAALGEKVTLSALTHFCEDEGLELPNEALDGFHEGADYRRILEKE